MSGGFAAAEDRLVVVSMASVTWISSSHSFANGNCVEVSAQDDGVHVRNSRNRVTELVFTRDEWDAFAAGMAGGEFERIRGK